MRYYDKKLDDNQYEKALLKYFVDYCTLRVLFIQ